MFEEEKLSNDMGKHRDPYGTEPRVLSIQQTKKHEACNRTTTGRIAEISQWRDPSPTPMDSRKAGKVENDIEGLCKSWPVQKQSNLCREVRKYEFPNDIKNIFEAIWRPRRLGLSADILKTI